MGPAQAADLAAAGAGGHGGPDQRTPVGVCGPGALDQPGCLFGGRRPGVGVGQRRLVGVLGRVDRDPLPHHCPVEGAADESSGSAGRSSPRARGTRAACRHGGRLAVAGSAGSRARVVLVAAVRLAGPVLQVWPAVAVLTASPQLRVEGVQGLDVEPGQRQRSEQRPDVLADVAVVAPSGRRVDVEDLEPLVEQLADGGPGARIALLVDLVQQPGADLLRLVTGLRPGRHDLGEVHPPLRDRVHPAVHPDPKGP